MPMAYVLSLPDFVLVSVVVLSPLGFSLVLLSAGEDRSCCHFTHWLRWVCLRSSNEHFLWDGVFNPVWFTHLSRLLHWFCVCNSHHTGCLGWRCHKRRLFHVRFSCSLLVSPFLSGLVPPSLLLLLNLVGDFGSPSFELLALVPSLDFHLSLPTFRSHESVLRVWPPYLVDTLLGRWHALHYVNKSNQSSIRQCRPPRWLLVYDDLRSSSTRLLVCARVNLGYT